MEDCMADHSDKEDPGAYCAQIHYNATGEWPAEKASDYVEWSNVGGDPFGDYDVLERFCEDLEDKGGEVLLGNEPWEHATGHHDRPVKVYGLTVEEAEEVWEDYEEEAVAIGGPKAKMVKDRPDEHRLGPLMTGPSLRMEQGELWCPEEREVYEVGGPTASYTCPGCDEELDGVDMVADIHTKQGEEFRYPRVPTEKTPEEVAEAIERFHEEVPEDVKEKTPLLYWLLGGSTPAYKMEKGDADYDTVPHGDMQCKNCEYYYESPDGTAICSQVRGDVQADHWCRLWEDGGIDLDKSPEVKSVEKVEDPDEDAVGKAFVHRHEAGADLFLKQENEGGWVPYEGPQGGTGWENTETGNRVYTDEPPGPTAEYVDEGQVLEGVTSLGELDAGDDIKVGDEIYEVQAVQEGPSGQMFTRVEHEGMEFTVTQDLIEAQVLGEALETGDYDVEQGTYEAELAEALVKGQLNEQGTEGFQNVRQLQHNLSEVENEKVLLDVLEHEAKNRNSKTAVKRIKGRCSAVGIEQSRIDSVLPGGDLDLDELDNVTMEELAEGQSVVVDPSGFPGVNEPVKGDVHTIDDGAMSRNVYVEPDDDLDYLQEGQVVEIGGERLEIDRIYEDENGNPDPSFVDPSDKTPIIGDDIPDFSDFEEEAEIVQDVDNDLLPVGLDNAEEDLYYENGERPDDPYPGAGYGSATEELDDLQVFESAGVGFTSTRKGGIENREALERIQKHATDEELRDYIEENRSSVNGDVRENARAAGAILFKRGEGDIDDVVNLRTTSQDEADATPEEVRQSTRETFEKVDTTTAAALAAHTESMKLDSYSALGCYTPTSQRITIDEYGSWSEDTVAHELGHSLHYLMGVKGDSHRDNTEKDSAEDYKFTVNNSGLNDEQAEQFADEFEDFVEQFEEDLKDKSEHFVRLRGYQTTNTNEVFAVAFGQWIDNENKLKHKQPELYDMFEEYFGSGGDEE
jgi:hypothetical protein